MKITNDMIHCAYQIGKSVYEGNLTRQDGKLKIHEESGMNIGSANDYIQILTCMLDGRVYKRAMSLYSTEYFLNQIGKEFGIERQKAAAIATIEHTKYYAEHCNGEQVSTRRLAEQYIK